MWLPSRLERSTLGDLLGGLHRGGVSGRLELITWELPSRAAIHFERGLVTRVDGAGPRLGERVATTWSERRRIDDALGLRGIEGLAGIELVRMGVASTVRLREALEAQARERLEMLFTIRRADIRFHVTGLAARGVPLALGPATFLHGRARAVPRPVRIGATQRVDPLRAAHALLGLEGSPSPSREVVRRAFRSRAAALHPDRARDPDARATLARAFRELSAAYERALAAC